MSVLDYLCEGLLNERNPHLDAYKTTKEVASKYRGEDYSIRFVEDFKDSKGQKINKVGVNTKRGWGNPRGVYAYWIDDFNEGSNAGFAVDYEASYILKRKDIGNQILDIGKLSRKDYMRYIDSLKSYVQQNFYSEMSDSEFDKKWLNYVKYAESETHNKTDGGILFYLVVILSESTDISKNRESDLIQTELWRRGMGVTFIGDKGYGIIHPNEESQVLYLSPKSYSVAEKIDNTKNYEQLKKLPTVNDMFASIRSKDIKKLITQISRYDNFDADLIDVIGDAITDELITDPNHLEKIHSGIGSIKIPAHAFRYIAVKAAKGSEKYKDILKYLLSMDNFYTKKYYDWDWLKELAIKYSMGPLLSYMVNTKKINITDADLKKAIRTYGGSSDSVKTLKKNMSRGVKAFYNKVFGRKGDYDNV